MLATIALTSLPPLTAAQCEPSKENRENFQTQVRVDCFALGQACNMADLDVDRFVTTLGVLSSRDACTLTVLPLDSASDGRNHCSMRVLPNGSLTRSTRGGWPPAGVINTTTEVVAEPRVEEFSNNCAAWCGDEPYETDAWWQQPGLFTCYQASRCARSLCLPDALQQAALTPRADAAPVAASAASPGSGQTPLSSDSAGTGAMPSQRAIAPQPAAAATPAAAAANRSTAQAPAPSTMPSPHPTAEASRGAARPGDPAISAATASAPVATPGAASESTRAASALLASAQRDQRELWRQRHVAIAASIASACALLLIALSIGGFVYYWRNRHHHRALAAPSQRSRADNDASAAQRTSNVLFEPRAAADTRAASISRAQATAAHTNRDYTDSPMSSLLPKRTEEHDDAHARLVVALENFANAEPPQLFAGKYLLLDERVVGGQAVVNFARGPGGSIFTYAIKCVTRDNHAYLVCGASTACVAPAAKGSVPDLPVRPAAMAPCKLQLLACARIRTAH